MAAKSKRKSTKKIVVNVYAQGEAKKKVRGLLGLLKLAVLAGVSFVIIKRIRRSIINNAKDDQLNKMIYDDIFYNKVTQHINKEKFKLSGNSAFPPRYSTIR